MCGPQLIELSPAVFFQIQAVFVLASWGGSGSLKLLYTTIPELFHKLFSPQTNCPYFMECNWHTMSPQYVFRRDNENGT